ncbi:MAG: heparan N-sulfatase, partial [Calditrichales bacterium]
MTRLKSCLLKITAPLHLILIVVLLANFAGCGEGDKQTPPNILVLIADDAGWRDFGCYGNDLIQTPHVDALAAAGMKMDRAFLTTPQCSPSRISILTGKYPHQTGAEDLHMPMPASETILPAYLQARGYFTGLLRKAHLGPAGEG